MKHALLITIITLLVSTGVMLVVRESSEKTVSDTARLLVCADGSEVYLDSASEMGAEVILPNGDVVQIGMHADTDSGPRYIADDGDFVMWYEGDATMIEIDDKLRYEDCLPE